MKKNLAYFILMLAIFIQAPSCSFAKNYTTAPVKIAIKKYKSGNYTGCLQDCQYIVKINPSNAVAYYYMAMSYVQAGKKDEAINAYSKVLSLKPNASLAEYATTGKRCLETPDKCVLETDSSTSPEIDKLIAAPFTDGLSDTVRKDFEQKRLDSFKNQINSGKDIDDYQLDRLNDASGQKSPAEAEIAKKPTNDEIAAALKVLSDAGLNPYAQTQISGLTANPYTQQFNQQNPEMAQINMLMNGNNQKNGDMMLNMLPLIYSQNKEGVNDLINAKEHTYHCEEGVNNYSPQLMQAVIMNSMMPDFTQEKNDY